MLWSTKKKPWNSRTWSNNSKCKNSRISPNSNKSLKNTEACTSMLVVPSKMLLRLPSKLKSNNSRKRFNNLTKSLKSRARKITNSKPTTSLSWEKSPKWRRLWVPPMSTSNSKWKLNLSRDNSYKLTIEEKNTKLESSLSKASSLNLNYNSVKLEVNLSKLLIFLTSRRWKEIMLSVKWNN